jgi:hypothetical protein
VVFRPYISSNAYWCKEIRRIIGIYRELVKLFRPTGVSHVHGVVVAVKSAKTHVRCDGEAVESLGFQPEFPPPSKESDGGMEEDRERE